MSAIAKLMYLPASKAAAAFSPRRWALGLSPGVHSPAQPQSSRVSAVSTTATLVHVPTRNAAAALCNTEITRRNRHLHPSLNERSECPGEGWTREHGRGEVTPRE